jgi:hypothetical protein
MVLPRNTIRGGSTAIAVTFGDRPEGETQKVITTLEHEGRKHRETYHERGQPSKPEQIFRPPDHLKRSHIALYCALPVICAIHCLCLMTVNRLLFFLTTRCPSDSEVGTQTVPGSSYAE